MRKNKNLTDSVWDPVWDSVWNSVWHSVRDSGRDPVRDSVRNSVRDSVKEVVIKKHIEWDYGLIVLWLLWLGVGFSYLYCTLVYK